MAQLKALRALKSDPGDSPLMVFMWEVVIATATCLRLANSGDDIARAPTWKDTLKVQKRNGMASGWWLRQLRYAW